MTDWQGRAKREAAAILAGSLPHTHAAIADYDTLLSLVAIGWLQGVSVGAHETLAQAEVAFANLRDSL